MKIFGIGLSKTGTTSLANALEILGYRVKDCLGVAEYRKGDLSSIDKDVLLNHDALTDTPIPSFYRELDAEYPRSKFILTVRDINGWLQSCKKQFNQKLADKQTEAHNQLFLDLYDTRVFDEEKFIVGYNKYVDAVLDYFKDRKDDLLVLDVTAGDGWEELCPFLGKSIPEIPFPKSNVTKIRWLNLHELASDVRYSTSNLKEYYQQLQVRENSGQDTSGGIAAFFKMDAKSKINKYADRAQKLIENNLTAANSSVPIITKDKHDASFDSRKEWNHFWLIDCSEGQPLLADGTIGYTINVCLIEDGFPFLGIIYSPSKDVLYYSALDKGAYKVVGKEQPIQIESVGKDVASSSVDSAIKINISWNLCQTADGRVIPGSDIVNSWEWQTAAGHAFIKAAGYKLIDNTNDELKYNKIDWKNPKLKVARK